MPAVKAEPTKPWMKAEVAVIELAPAEVSVPSAGLTVIAGAEWNGPMPAAAKLSVVPDEPTEKL